MVQNNNRSKRQTGASLPELLVALVVGGLAMTGLTANLGPASAPVESGAEQLEGFFRLARARAVATTSAYRVLPTDSSTVIAEYASSCAHTGWTAEERRVLELPQDVTMSDSSWSVCFNSRGVAMVNVVVELVHPEARPRSVEVLVGGSARVVP